MIKFMIRWIKERVAYQPVRIKRWVRRQMFKVVDGLYDLVYDLGTSILVWSDALWNLREKYED